jgi:hypothetical protein
LSFTLLLLQIMFSSMSSRRKIDISIPLYFLP